MTDVDENLLTAAKLFEQLRGNLDGGADIHPHAGLVRDEDHRNNLSFLRSIDGVPKELVENVEKTLATDLASNAINDGNYGQISHLVGVTESRNAGNALSLAMELNSLQENNDAPAFIIGVGNPNTGKTNTVTMLAELRRAALEDDLLIVSNVRSLEVADRHVASAHDLLVTLLEDRETKKYVILDEGSTHFDARTFRREVAVQFTPVAKRFAKIGVDVFATIGHTGKDIHPELKRLCTLAFDKETKKELEFFDSWPADSDKPSGRLLGGPIIDLEAARSDYDPDDAAPWAWNLEPELFSLDLDWDELLTELKARGPAT